MFGIDARGNRRSVALRKCAPQLLANCSTGGEPGFQSEQQSLGSAASHAQKTGALESFARKHDARADVEAAGDAIRLLHHDARNPELLAADANGIACFDIQPQPKVVGDHGGVGVKPISQVARRDRVSAFHKTGRRSGPRLSPSPARDRRAAFDDTIESVSVTRVYSTPRFTSESMPPAARPWAARTAARKCRRP